MVEEKIIDFICLRCIHFNSDKSFAPIFKCKAFDKIPNEIVYGKNDHKKPLKNQDNNIVFEKL